MECRIVVPTLLEIRLSCCRASIVWYRSFSGTLLLDYFSIVRARNGVFAVAMATDSLTSNDVLISLRAIRLISKIRLLFESRSNCLVSIYLKTQSTFYIQCLLRLWRKKRQLILCRSLTSKRSVGELREWTKNEQNLGTRKSVARMTEPAIKRCRCFPKGIMSVRRLYCGAQYIWNLFINAPSI